MKKLIRHFINLSVSWKFVLAYFAILILPMMFSGIYLYLKTLDSAIKQAELVMRQNLLQTRTSILEKVNAVETASRFLTGDLKVQTVLINQYPDEVHRIQEFQFEISPFANNILGLNRMISSLRFYLPDSIITQSTDSYYSINKRSMPEWFHHFASKKPVQSGWISSHEAVANPVRPDNRTAEQVFSYNSEIRSETTRSVLGTLEIEVKESVLFEMLRDPVIRKMGKVFIADGNGIIISNNIPEFYKRSVADIGLTDFLNSRKESEVKKVLNIESIVIAIPIEGLDCNVVGIFPVDNFNREVKSSLPYIILVLVASSLLLGTVLYIITNILLRRVKRLVKAMKQVREGNLDVSVKFKSMDEFGELALSFNHMTGRIHELVETVYKIQLLEREAELKALEAQVNPHFLYNTLATISWVARKANVYEIVKISNSLAKFYRLVLSKGERLICFNEELEMVSAYLQIQKTRFESMFDTSFELEEGIEDLKVLKNILQPLVENALNHGIEPKRGHGTILIKAGEHEDRLRIQIIDDGVGMKPKTLAELLEGKVERSAGSGYAIKNVVERLKAFYGNEYTFEISSRPGIGTAITITLAKR
ncbi:MAG: sensor histidine kinase [Clostridia bacterium]|nr:sensor histidine kinase [Clostridia bacterium]